MTHVMEFLTFPSRIRLAFLLVAGIVCSSGSLHAEDNESLLISTATIVTANESQSAEFQTPAITPDKVVALEFEARGEPGTSESALNYLLKIRINGKEVVSASDRLQSLLRNKPPTESGQAWHRRLVGWLIPLAADFPIQPDEKFKTVVEIEPLLQPGSSQIDFSLLRQADQKQRVHLRNIRLIYLPRQPTAAHFEIPADQSSTLVTTPGEDLAIRHDGLDYALTTSVGHPGGGWMQRGPPVTYWNSKTVPARSGETPDGIQTDSILWVRRVRQLTADHLVVEEEITNVGDNETGTMFRIDLPFPRPLINAYLNGDPDPSQIQNRDPANPTLFIPLGGKSLGFVAEDDLSRSQMIMSCRPDSGAVSLRAERLFLPAKGTLRLRWSLYLLPGSDYFDFINRLRSDWGIRLRIPGSFWWNAFSRVGKSDGDLQRWLTEQRPFAAVIGSWVDKEKNDHPQMVGLGTGVMETEFDDYRNRLKHFVTRLKRIDPQLKVLLYNHYFFNWPEPDPNRYRDSWIITPEGNRFVVPASSEESEAPGVYPTRGNLFGEDFRQMLVRQRRELGIDGFYFDETTAPGRLHDPITYGAIDGVTALLDPKTFEIKAKVGSIPLLTAPYLSQLSHQLLEARLIALGNFPPETGEQNRMTWPRFVETDNLRHCATGHLYSPLAFSYHFEDYKVEEIRERLEQGLVWCVTGPEDKIGIVKHFFPLTPTALHAGWIEGEERIITSRSGLYGWNGGPSMARTWVYDANGKPTELNPSWTMITQPTQINVPVGGIAILERRTE